MAMLRGTSLFSAPISLWKECGGFYQCPKGADGSRRGPLVGYAGTYRDDLDLTKQYVGEVYFNFAAVEQHPQALRRFAQMLMIQAEQDRPTVLLGAPMGGIGLAFALGYFLDDTRVIFAEKNVHAQGTGKQQTSFFIKRHELHPKDRVAIIEDVCNSFSTTDELIKLVTAAGATVCSIGCALNRSGIDRYHSSEGLDINVRHVIRIPSPKFKQTDQEVYDDVRKGNVVWKPKLEWERLMSAMNSSSEELCHGNEQKRPPST